MFKRCQPHRHGGVDVAGDNVAEDSSPVNFTERLSYSEIYEEIKAHAAITSQSEARAN